jgi:hypothetical protein
VTSSTGSRVYFDITTDQLWNFSGWPSATEFIGEIGKTPGKRARQKVTGALIIGGVNQMIREFRPS